MRVAIAGLAWVMALALALMAGPAYAADMDDMLCEATTIEALHHCVAHAAEGGHITQAGVAHSLLAKIEAADAAASRGQVAVAVAQLQAFIHEVEAQSGKSVDAMHADHMVSHAQRVIDTLTP